MEPREQTNLFGYSKEFNKLLSIYTTQENCQIKLFFLEKKGLANQLLLFT